ncbi:surface [Bluegill hepatitis B virus]|uniref:Large envelope protein n=1 Tax=Bluegill hepatitis B virus TaxID=2169918 RepID=A0A193AUI9_9HEPA|nr:surface [Bluegill hepatitis B virus]ANN02849.1 surface [Bluegill hepatitis B virus]
MGGAQSDPVADAVNILLATEKNKTLPSAARIDIANTPQAKRLAELARQHQQNLQPPIQAPPPPKPPPIAIPPLATDAAPGPVLTRRTNDRKKTPVYHVTTAPTAAATAATPTSPPQMTGFFSGWELGFPLVLQVVFFLWTKIHEIIGKLDSWWIFLSSPECLTGSGGLGLHPQISPHLPTNCQPGCPGYPWTCLRRFIIFLCILALFVILSLVYLDWIGMLFCCCCNGSDCTNCTCSGSNGKCCCVCKDCANCDQCSWAFVKHLWALASAHFSWLSSLESLSSISAHSFKVSVVLLIWMMWWWGITLTSIWQVSFMLFTTYYFLWGST